jgi:hypothetical protein
MFHLWHGRCLIFSREVVKQLEEIGMNALPLTLNVGLGPVFGVMEAAGNTLSTFAEILGDLLDSEELSLTSEDLSLSSLTVEELAQLEKKVEQMLTLINAG